MSRTSDYLDRYLDDDDLRAAEQEVAHFRDLLASERERTELMVETVDQALDALREGDVESATTILESLNE